LEDETSGSLEALQALNEGIRLKNDQSMAAALPQYKRAVELDPNLVWAHLNLGADYLYFGDIQLGTRQMNMGFNLRERLSKRSRWFTEAVYYSLATGELEKADATYTEWVQAFPADFYAHQNFPFALRPLGQHERAVVEAREAVRLVPSAVSYDGLMLQLLYMNRLEDARAVWNEAKARGFDTAPTIRQERYLLAFLEDDRAAMQEQLTWAMGKPGAEAGVLYLHSCSEAYHGHFHSAHRYMLLAMESAQRSDGPNTIANYESQETLWESEAGVAGARRKAIKALAGSPGRDARLRLALAVVRTGEARIAEEVADELGKEFPVATVVQKLQLPTIRAAIELHNNNPGRAIEILRVAAPYDLAGTNWFGEGWPAFGELWPAYVRGLAYLQTGEGQQAAAEFQKLLDHSGVVGSCVTGALARFQLGRAQVMMGDKAAARKSYQDFLTLWKDADPDIPIYKQAKAEYASLRD
jgi:tetratricopeptide (TPR) repeat protein